MKKTPSDIALLESALATIEQVLARADSDTAGRTVRRAHRQRAARGAARGKPPERRAASAPAPRSPPSTSASSSAAALVDVSQALLNRSHRPLAAELEREWQALIAHTKIASRSAYRAALIMAAQKNVLAAQGEAQTRTRSYCRRPAH